MKRFVKQAVPILLSFSIASLSFPAIAYRVDYDGGNFDFNLSGSLKKEMAGEIVTIKAEKDNAVLYTRQTDTNYKGEYFFTFNVLRDLYGDINIVVNEGENTISCLMYKSTSEEVERALALISSQGIESAVLANDAITNTPVAKILQVNADDFPQNGLMTQYISGKSYTTLNQFLKAYKMGKFLNELANASADNENLYTMMQDCQASQLLAGKAFEIFKAYPISEQKSVLERLKGKTCTSDESFKDSITDAVIMNELSKVSTNNEKWAVISLNNDYLELNLSKYENSSVFASLKTQLFKNKLSSVAAMKEQLESIYNALVLENGEGDNRGGSSGRGGKKEYAEASSELILPQKDPDTFGFNDLINYEWARDAILSLAADGIVSGKGNKQFVPSDYVTRAEFTKIIIGAFHFTEDDTQMNFLDVSKEHWGYQYIAVAVKKRIVNGISDTQFNPNGKITRQDMATICYRVLENTGKIVDPAGKKEFGDENEISEYAKKAVEVLSGMGIINGTGNKMFAPKDFATRAEAAKIIHSLCKLQ